MGGLGGQKCKSLENLPNGWNDWHQIWYTSADSSRNGQLAPRYNTGHWGGEVLGVKNSKVWKIYQIWYTSTDSYGNGHRLKTNIPSSPGFILGFMWSKFNQKFEECHDLQGKNENKLYKNEMHK